MARRRSIISNRQYPLGLDRDAAAWYAWIYAEILRMQGVPLDVRIEHVQKRYARFQLVLPNPMKIRTERVRDKIYAHTS